MHLIYVWSYHIKRSNQEELCIVITCIYIKIVVACQPYVTPYTWVLSIFTPESQCDKIFHGVTWWTLTCIWHWNFFICKWNPCWIWTLLIFFVQAECPYCYLSPCAVEVGHEWLGRGRQPHPQNRVIRKRLYYKFWALIYNLGGWRDERYIAKKELLLATFSDAEERRCPNVYLRCVLSSGNYTWYQIAVYIGHLLSNIAAWVNAWARWRRGAHIMQDALHAVIQRAISRTLYTIGVGCMAMTVIKFYQG